MLLEHGQAWSVHNSLPLCLDLQFTDGQCIAYSFARIQYEDVLKLSKAKSRHVAWTGTGQPYLFAVRASAYKLNSITIRVVNALCGPQLLVKAFSAPV